MMANSKSTSNKTVSGSLPCGNPKRYTNADVIQMQKEGRKHLRDSIYSSASNDQTEASQHIQTLLEHQTRTEITLNEQFSKHRNFIESSSHAPTADKLDGLHTSEEHVKFDAFDSRVNYLKSCGLTDKEIDFKLKQESLGKDQSSKRPGYGADPAINKLIEQEIDRKISEKEESLMKPDKFIGGVEISRHALVLEKSILEKQNKKSTLPDCLFTQKKLDSKHPDDPINHIGDIMLDIEPKPSREPRRERRRKRKLNEKLLRQQEYLGVESNPKIRKEFMKSVGLEPESSADQLNNVESLNVEISGCKVQNIGSSDSEYGARTFEKDKDDSLPVQEEQPKEEYVPVRKQHDGCEKTETFTVSSCGCDVPFLTETEIQSNRLSLQEILCIEKFRNYDRGTPNKILFVKNLPNNVNELDLVSLFGGLQQSGTPEISFRLLKGRMKGQAFVTFPDADCAAEAITKLNGYKLRGKPVVISFGKRQENCTDHKEETE